MEIKKVNSFSDLQKLVASLATLDVTSPFSVTTTDAEGSKNTITIAGNEGHNIQYKMLLEGFNALKSQSEFYEGVTLEGQVDAEFGGFLPTSLVGLKPAMDWIDRFVTRNLGGQRDNLKVVWSLPEGKFELDPWTLQLAKRD